MKYTTLRLPAEWEEQAAILIAWPHDNTDWNYMLQEVEECYIKVAKAIACDEDLIIVTPQVSAVKSKLADVLDDNIHVFQVSTNDTWARDFGPISVIENGASVLYDFMFNAWGLKFPANYDNLITSSLHKLGAFKTKLHNKLNFVLEGGSIESDGNGTLLTTTECLLSPNRNGEFTKGEIENYLISQFGLKKIIWLNHGFLSGDDTDSHIDTLARICPHNIIAYVGCDDVQDEHYKELKLMEEELKAATNAQGEPFNLVKLPFPAPIYDENGIRLPATYANFLITNNQVLVPTYGQPDNDVLALRLINQIFPDRKITGIDCRPLIKQHGSLHCITMQLAKGTF